MTVLGVRFGLLRALVVAAAAFAAATALAQEAQEKPFDEDALLAAEQPPPAPPGFKSPLEVMLAIQMGKVPLISLGNVSLPEGVVEQKDIEYGKVGDRQLLLDLYAPANMDAPAPALVFMHGGGWEKGQRGDYKFYAVRFAKRGYVVATVSYRFTDEATFPACIQDVKCAVRWMRANADKYHIDPKHIGAVGGSAGGYLAMMLGYTAGVAEFEGDGGHAEQSSAVQAVVDFYGPCDLTDPLSRNHPVILKLYGGKTYEEIPQQYELGSPIKHLDKTDPPTLIFHGTIDELVPLEHSQRLAKELSGLGVPCELEIFEGYPHTMDMARDVNVRCQWFMNRFFAKYLPLPAKK